MHAEVVTALDAHLAELQALRHQLTDARAIEPGERLDSSCKSLPALNASLTSFMPIA